MISSKLGRFFLYDRVVRPLSPLLGHHSNRLQLRRLEELAWLGAVGRQLTCMAAAGSLVAAGECAHARHSSCHRAGGSVVLIDLARQHLQRQAVHSSRVHGLGWQGGRLLSWDVVSVCHAQRR